MSSAHAIKADLSDSNVRLGTSAATVQQVAGLVGMYLCTRSTLVDKPPLAAES